MREWLEKRLQELAPAKTKQGLAKSLGVAPPQMTMLLAGRRRVKVPEVPKIAAYLEWPEGLVYALALSDEDPQGHPYGPALDLSIRAFHEGVLVPHTEGLNVEVMMRPKVSELLKIVAKLGDEASYDTLLNLAYKLHFNETEGHRPSPMVGQEK